MIDTARAMQWLALVAVLATAPHGEAAEPASLVQIAEGIWMHPGRQEDATAENAGDIANLGFIVGEKCVAVIDTGGSVAIGRRLRAAVRTVTALPVCYVINTHVHPDHILGNAAFAADAPVYVGHARLGAAMAARGRIYLNAVRRDYGAIAEGIEIIPPSRQVEDQEELDLGGRVLELRAWPTAHTDNDLTVFDRRTGTLWLSDLLFVDRIPVIDGSLRGWLRSHGALRSLVADRVVPGHGPVQADARPALAAQERYLSALRDQVRDAIRARRTIAQAVEHAESDEARHWLLHESFHRRNVTAAYAELEWED